MCLTSPNGLVGKHRHAKETIMIEQPTLCPISRKMTTLADPALESGAQTPPSMLRFNLDYMVAYWQKSTGRTASGSIPTIILVPQSGCAVDLLWLR